MITDTLTRIFTSRPFKLLLVLVILLGIATQAVPQFIDTKPYIERLTKIVRETSGASLMIKGENHFQLIPRPALIIRDAEISQPNVERSPTLSADVAEIGFDLSSLFSEVPIINSVRVSGAALVTERNPEGKVDWGFLGVPFLKILSSAKPEAPVRFEILSGNISVADVKSGQSANLSNVQLTGRLAGDTMFSGSVVYNDTPIIFSASRNGTVGATPIEIKLDAGGGSTVSLKGNMDFTAENPVVTAKLNIVATDISTFITKKSPVDLPQSTNADPVPLKLSADYSQQKGLIALSNIDVEALNSTAKGNWQWNGAPDNSHKFALNFSTLDLAAAKKILGSLITYTGTSSDNYAPKTLVDKSITASLDIVADKVTNGAQSWSRASFNGEISDGALTVNQLSVAMPGDSAVAVFGLLSVSDTQGLRFEGNIDAQGTSLREALTIFDESAANLPQLGFGAYKLRSNLFVSKELLRLSEADAQFSELSFKGGLVAYFDGKPRVEADIALRDINFDYFRDSWRSGEHSEANPVFLRFDRGMNFDWLKKLAAVVDFRVSAQSFTFLERKGNSANFRLFAQAGEFGIYNAKFDFGTDVTEGNLKLDVKNTVPNLNLVLNTAALNTNYFSLKPEPVMAIAQPPAATTPPEAKTDEALPDMVLPEAKAPEDEMRAKIDEEAAQMQTEAATTEAVGKLPIIDAEKSNEAAPVEHIPDPVELTPLSEDSPDIQTNITTTPQALISSALAQVVPPPEPNPTQAETAISRWSETAIDFSALEGINGSFDISIGKLQHKDKLFENFKLLAKLDRSVLSFQALTFSHWGGSFSINGSMFGGKVPGFSLGFIIASADLKQVLGNLLDIDEIGGKASISGTIETSGVNMPSWIAQASAKMLVAGRGVTIEGFDVASVPNAVSMSRTAADVFNNVNLMLVGSNGEYTADGAINLQKGVISTPGIALKSGRVLGTVTGDFRLIPWDLNLSGVFKFPDLATENVPTMTVRWSGPVEHPSLQTDTQSLEAFVSKRITGN